MSSGIQAPPQSHLDLLYGLSAIACRKDTTLNSSGKVRTSLDGMDWNQAPTPFPLILVSLSLSKAAIDKQVYLERCPNSGCATDFLLYQFCQGSETCWRKSVYGRTFFKCKWTQQSWTHGLQGEGHSRTKMEHWGKSLMEYTREDEKGEQRLFVHLSQSMMFKEACFPEINYGPYPNNFI